MTSQETEFQRQKKKRKKVSEESGQQFDELVDLHKGLEEALNNRDKADKSAFIWTIRTAETEAERMHKEGMSESEISKICSIICKRHPIHERQIQKYFDHVDEFGNRPYRKYKRQYTKDQLTKANKFGIKDEIHESDLKTDEVVTSLEKLLGDDISDYGTDNLHKITDLAYRVVKHNEIEFEANKIPYINPYSENKLKNMLGDRKKIRLNPADIPEDERIRAIQKLQGEQHYHANKNHKIMGDAMTKMNYISDDSKLGEELIIRLMQQIIIQHLELDKLSEGVQSYFKRYYPNHPFSKIIDEVLHKKGSYIGALYKNFRDKERGYRAKRSIDLHDKLSDSA